VLRALSHQAGLFPQLDLAPPDTSDLNVRDAAFAHAIYDAVIRRWLTLTTIAERYLSRPFNQLDIPVRAALLAGGAQLLLLDRVPPHAAINESVEWIKRTWKPEARGVVNAVLRRISALVHGEADTGLPDAPTRGAWNGATDQLPLSDGSALKLRDHVFPAERIERLAATTSHPAPLLQRWHRRWGWDRTLALATHNLSHAPVTLNTAHCGYIDLPQLSPHDVAGHHVFHGTRNELADCLAARPEVWVQDAASSRAIASIADLRPAVVLDLCAGQGTKTRQLAATFPGARIIATDTDARRRATLRETAALNRRIEAVDPDALGTTRAFDLVLTDVPCSNSGVLARRTEARYRCDDAQLERLTALQREILGRAFSLLKPGGAVLYSTCSLEPEENEEQVRPEGLSKVAGGPVTVERITRTWPQGMPGDPPRHYGDGAFSALIHIR
jgi:16S rRNA (cytosine967-C5)-methyltransferase